MKTNNNKLCGRPLQYAHAPVTLIFDLESGVPVTCDVGYLRANCSLPRPLCSRLRPDVRDRQTDVRQHYRLMRPPSGRGIIIGLNQTYIAPSGHWSAGAVMNRLCKPVFKRHDVSLSLKLQLLNACMMAVMAYIAVLNIDNRNRKEDRRMWKLMALPDCCELITKIGLPKEKKLEKGQRRFSLWYGIVEFNVPLDTV